MERFSFVGFELTMRTLQRGTATLAPPASQRASVEMLHRDSVQVDAFEAANIDRRYPIAILIGSFSIRVNAAVCAKAMLDNVLVKSVSGDIFLAGEQTEPVARHEP
jgi:hypothetical protein